jgi:hypothetical protein
MWQLSHVKADIKIDKWSKNDIKRTNTSGDIGAGISHNQLRGGTYFFAQVTKSAKSQQCSQVFESKLHHVKAYIKLYWGVQLCINLGSSFGVGLGFVLEIRCHDSWYKKCETGKFGRVFLP